MSCAGFTTYSLAAWPARLACPRFGRTADQPGLSARPRSGSRISTKFGPASHMRRAVRPRSSRLRPGADVHQSRATLHAAGDASDEGLLRRGDQDLSASAGLRFRRQPRLHLASRIRVQVLKWLVDPAESTVLRRTES